MATVERQYVAALTRERAKALTLARGGDWNDDRRTGRNAGCFVCGAYAMAVTAKPKGVVMCCNECGAGKARGDNALLDAAVVAGFERGRGPTRRRGNPSMLPKAPDASLVGLKRAERRVLTFCAGQTATRQWFEISQRAIVAECGGSKRDAIPLLGRLAERGLIRVRSNNYTLRRRTQVAFLVDPVDLVGRSKMVSPAPEMVSP